MNKLKKMSYYRRRRRRRKNSGGKEYLDSWIERKTKKKNTNEFGYLVDANERDSLRVESVDLFFRNDEIV